MKTRLTEEDALEFIRKFVLAVEKWGKQADPRQHEQLPEAVYVLYKAGRIGTSHAEIVKANRQVAAANARVARLSGKDVRATDGAA